MPCYHPIRGYQGSDGSVFFVELRRSQAVRVLDLPCGRCIGCRLERSRQWAVRCMHEAQMHEVNCFVTLTYEVAPRSLDYTDFQKFLKRLRKNSKKRIRYFACGEYGDEGGRPHFHACLFGIDFTDKRVFSRRDGITLYTSDALTKCWGHGYCTVGDVTFDSAGYVARYCVKKVNGDMAKEHYTRLDPISGELYEIEPEMGHMSLKPGIGAMWLDKFGDDVYPRGEVVVRGVKGKAPRYYDKWYKRVDEQQLQDVTLFERELKARKRWMDQSDERLAVREAVTLAAISQLKRT